MKPKKKPFAVKTRLPYHKLVNITVIHCSIQNLKDTILYIIDEKNVTTMNTTIWTISTSEMIKITHSDRTSHVDTVTHKSNKLYGEGSSEPRFLGSSKTAILFSLLYSHRGRLTCLIDLDTTKKSKIPSNTCFYVKKLIGTYYGHVLTVTLDHSKN